jgi:electron transport complex protein RnfE
MHRDMNDYGKILRNGIWHDNPGLAQLLGLCPLLAVSNTVVNGIGLGLATLFVVCATNLLISLTRGLISPQVRLPVFVLIIASLVTVIELTFKAFFYELYLNLGLFIPLITTNCLILGRAEAFASRRPVIPSLIDGLGHGLGFAMVLIVLGAIRELFGYGSLFRGADMLIGGTGQGAAISLLPKDTGLILMLLPPGAFIVLGLVVALRNYLVTDKQSAAMPAHAAESASS